MKTSTATRTLLSALAIAFGAVAMSPTDIQAGPSYENYYKQHRKNQKKAIKHHYKSNNYRRPSYHSPYDYNSYRSPYYGSYRTPRYERESFHIYGTPGGGLGFSYSEYNRR
jgi:hypothetical protein